MTYPSKKVAMLALCGIVLAALSLLTVDQSLALYFKQPELTGLWLKARAITNIGLSEHYFLLAIFAYIYGKWIRPTHSRVREWGRDFFFALIGSGILIHIVKFCCGRQRPHISEDFNPWVFHPFTTNWNYHSFASGHTQVMFTVATVFSLTFPKWKWLFFAIATVIGLTRVIIHDHFLSDVIGGAVIGYVGAVTSIYWVHRGQRRSSKQSDTGSSAVV